MASTKCFSVIALVILLTSPSWAQRWEWQNPTLTGNALISVGALDDENAYASSDAGDVLWTTDGGASWDKRCVLYGFPLDKLVFVSADEGWALSVCFVPFHFVSWVLHTIDGGRTWEFQFGGATAVFSDITFVDPLHGWAVGYAESDLSPGAVVARTTDGGVSWTQTRYPDNVHFETVSFISPLEGWVSSQYDSLMHTLDGGETWSAINGDCFAAWALKFVNSQVGWGLGYRGMYRTEDGGNNWVDLNPDGAYPRMHQMSALDAQTAWFANESGDLVQTLDGGLTLTDQSAGFPAGVFNLAFSPIRGGWGVGGAGAIFRTDDAGSNWDRQSGRQETEDLDIVDIDFPDSQNGWAAAGNVLRTTDAGRTWNVLHNFGARGVCAVDARTAWVLGPDGRVFFTDDGGAVWDTMAVQPNMDFVRIFALGLENVWVLGGGVWNTPLYRTTDAGQTWTGYSFDMPFDVFDMVFTDTLNGWICGGQSEMGGYIMHTGDGGASWTRQYGFDALDIPARGFCFLDSEHGWACRDVRDLLVTSDGGLTWEERGTPVDYLEHVQFFDELNGWISSGLHRIYKTTDGGNTWDQVYTGSGAQVHAMDFPDPDHGWIAGPHGSILHYNANPNAQLPRPVAAAPAAIGLSAYPNPFNSSARISFSLPAAGPVAIRVFDVNGRFVTELANRVYSAGTFDVNFNGSGLASGAYFVRLQNASRVQSRKLLLVK